MNGLREYIYTMIGASIFCAVIISLVPRESKHRKTIQMLSGLFLLLSLILPLKYKQGFKFAFDFESIKETGETVAQEGVLDADSTLNQLIKEQTEAYILDKATAMGADIIVTVTVGTNAPPVPIAVNLEGSISPYAKTKLTTIIANDIGIPEDQQVWI